ncbi:MAG TPA: D-alanyl-D-alanine carboxypeptidase family protein [Caulobacteraceae bacterium]|jgi:D-alanyl-D-alanine carboxypeptidase (penicillin-binding protein 5/6)|nr:D-alanyl-D-alanine carboxypeptidase family protein [Caulobacteraceae bacterium]
MIKPARRLSVFTAFVAFATLLTAALAPGAEAKAQSLYNQPKYAAIVVDAATGEVLYARRADQPRYPASITKVMTFYLVFEALATGRLSLQDRIVVSDHAAAQPPSKSGMRPGESITVDEALRVTALKSANDLAVAFAEKIGGSEARFAALMTLRAQELGMTNTRFVNANGLPDTRQITTARDIAILSRAVMRDYPQYYSYFSQKTYEFRGRTISNHNALLHKMPGVDGIKTGYTNAAGFNLAASAVRDGRRLITVVLGGQSTAARDENVEELLNAGFDVLAKRKLGQTITVAANMREPDDVAGPVMRVATEQGSGEQAGLQVAVAENQLRGPAGGAPTAAWLNAAAQPSSGLKAATLALADPSREAPKPDCAKVTQKVKVKARRGHRARTETVTRTVCKTSPRDGVQVAKASAQAATADDCAKVATKGLSRKARIAVERRRAKACKAAAETTQLAAAGKAGAAEKAGLKGEAGGAYRIQVGAFDSKGAAKEHISKIAKHYGPVVASASSQVEPASRGNYRARFAGFSAQGAKAACAALSAKGERCMVVAPS